MKIITQDNLEEIISELLNGKTIVFPTETSYGLGCDATNQEAVDKIFKIKNRDKNKPLLVVAPSIEMAKKYLMWNDLLDKIAKKYWPGPVTVIAEIQDSRFKIQKLGLANGVMSRGGTLALRVTNHPLLKSITKKLGRPARNATHSVAGGPLVATSANISGEGDIYDVVKVAGQFKNRKFQPDIILDCGKLPERKPSTLVSVVSNQLRILRQGEVNIEL